MSQSSILTSRQKISGHKVSMSRHSALIHYSGVRRCVANKAGCARDRGALQRTTEALCSARQRSCVAHDRAWHAWQVCVRDWDARTT